MLVYVIMLMQGKRVLALEKIILNYQRETSIDWGRSRAAYQYFGDIVTFDATYLTNRYKMHFVHFY
jgi:hypothetical protein